MDIKALSISAALVCAGLSAASVGASCPDLALVLAIDGSGSIDHEDFTMQQAGYAAAFGDGEVQRALASAGVVDVAVVLWGDETIPPQVVPWQRISTEGDAARVARKIADLPRRVTGDTGIGQGIWTALDLLDSVRACAARRIINVSGDGIESHGARHRSHYPLAAARDRAAAMGVTINGLAILASVADLEDWYRDKVITGPGAFVMTVGSFDAFGEAIIRKLSREIALPVVASLKTTPEVLR